MVYHDFREQSSVGGCPGACVPVDREETYPDFPIVTYSCPCLGERYNMV